VLAEDDEADIVRVSFSQSPPARRRGDQRPRALARDRSGAEKDLALLAGYRPGDIEFTGRSYRNRKVTVYFERDDASGEYVLLDRETSTVRCRFISA